MKYPKTWTEEEEQRLIKRYREGMTIKQLAGIHNRRIESIVARLVRLGAMQFDNDTLKVI